MTMTTNNKATTSSSSSSLLTMSTRALVICLATSSSCDAAFSSGGSAVGAERRVRSVVVGASQHNNPPWRCCRRSTSTSTKTITLYYRDGDDDQPLTMQAANQSAVDDAVVVVLGDGASSLPSPSVLASTEESVTSPTGPHPPLRMLSSHIARSMIPAPILRSMMMITTTLPRQQQSITTTPPLIVRDEQQQLVMDEYLEFVQRRYNRLKQPTTSQSKASSSGHQQRSKPSNNNISLSRLTLSHRPLPSLTPTPTTMSLTSSRIIASKKVVVHDNIIMAVEEEDPLQALGLSDLASEKLRQRLHVHVQPTTAAFVNYQMTTRDTASPIKASSTTTAAASCVTSSIVGALPQIMRVLTSLHRIACSFLHTFLIQWGGLRHSTRIMSVISVALVAFVSRHVSKQSGG